MAAPILLCQTLLCLLTPKGSLDPTIISRQLFEAQQQLPFQLPSRKDTSSPDNLLHPTIIHAPLFVPIEAIAALNNAPSDRDVPLKLDGDALRFPETLNSTPSASWTSAASSSSSSESSESSGSSSWPPVFVASDSAQRFFDRIHGYATAEKPVTSDDDSNAAFNVTTTEQLLEPTPKAKITSTTTTTTRSPSATSTITADVPFVVIHANAVDGGELHGPSTASKPSSTVPSSRQAYDNIAHKSTFLKKNTIFSRPAAATPTKHVRVKKHIPHDMLDSSRQMFSSLSDRIFANLAANNKYVNWTQSVEPQVVYSTDNLPIAQFPFVVVQPPPPPPKVQEPPRRGWFQIFYRPTRIYGPGTESKFPPVVENVVKRIQNYFSVFKYQNNNRPFINHGGDTVQQEQEPQVQQQPQPATDEGLDEVVMNVKPLTDGEFSSKPSGEFVLLFDDQTDKVDDEYDALFDGVNQTGIISVGEPNSVSLNKHIHSELNTETTQIEFQANAQTTETNLIAIIANNVTLSTLFVSQSNPDKIAATEQINSEVESNTINTSTEENFKLDTRILKSETATDIQTIQSRETISVEQPTENNLNNISNSRIHYNVTTATENIAMEVPSITDELPTTTETIKSIIENDTVTSTTELSTHKDTITELPVTTPSNRETTETNTYNNNNINNNTSANNIKSDSDI